MVWSSTVCSCRAGSSSENDTWASPSGLLNRVEASTSGVRQACICHHSVQAAIQKSASEAAAMKTDVSTEDPPRSLNSPCAAEHPRAPPPPRNGDETRGNV